LTDGGSLKRPYEPSPYDSHGHPMKSATVISDSSVLGQPSLSEPSLNVAVKQQQIMFQPVPDNNPITVDASCFQRPSTGAVVVSAAELAVKREVQTVISSTPPVLPTVTPSLVPVPVTYATGMIDQSAVRAALGGLQLAGHSVDAGAGYVTNTVPLNQSVIQFLQQQQSAMQNASVPGTVPGTVPVIQTASVPHSVPIVSSTELNRNTVSNILAAAQKSKLTADNTNIQMLMNLLNCGANKAPGVSTVQWAPAAAHTSNVPPPGSQSNSPFFVQNFATVDAVPQDLSNQLVFSLNPSTSFTGSFATPSVMNYSTTPASVSSVLLATPAVSSPLLAHTLTANDQVLNLTLHSGNQHMDINASESYSSRMNASQANSFSHLESNVFVASADEKSQGFCNMTAVSVATSTYAEPMALAAAHFPADAHPPPAKAMICMTNTAANAVNQVLVQQHDAHNFGSNVIVHMDITSSLQPQVKSEQTPATELPHDINATGIMSGNLEPSSLYLTGNNPMLAEASSQPQSQNAVDMQGFSSQPVLGMDICNGHLTGLNVAAEPAALNVVSSPTDESSANSMSSTLQQSLAELLDLQQQINAVNVSATQSVQPSAVLDSPLTRELPPVPSESMQWVSSTTGCGQTTTAKVPAVSDVVLASANVGTINLLTAAEVLNNSTYGQDANHEVFYSPQPATSYAVVIGSAGNSHETSATSWNHQAVQSSYASLTTNENSLTEVKQEQLSDTGDVVLDLLTTISPATGRPSDSQLYTQQTAGEVPSDFFNNSDATSPATSSCSLTGTAGTESTQSVIYVVNQVGVDNSGTAQEPGTQPIAYHIVTANQLPNCNQSQDIGIVQYAASQQIQPAAASDVHSPTSSGFRVLTADAMPPTSTDGGIQFQLSQPISFGSKAHCCCSVNL